MAAVRYSRYEFADVQKDDQGRVYLDVPDPPSRTTLLRQADRSIVASGDTLWAIAWSRYRAVLDRAEDLRPTGFWFAVAWANDVVDATVALEVGTVAFAPSIETLLVDVLVPPPFLPRSSTT